MKEVTNRKKKIATIIGVAALPLAAALTFNPNVVSNNGDMDVNLGNVEALAKNEVSVGSMCMYAYGTCDYGDGDVYNGVFV